MNHLRLFSCVQLMIVLALLMPLYLARRLEHTSIGVSAAVAWSIVIYSSVRLGLLAANGSKRLVSMTFWIFVYVWLGVTPLLQILADSFPLPGLYSPTQITVALGVVLLGLLAYDVGGAIGRETDESSGGRAIRVLRRRLSPSRAILAALAAMLIAGILVVNLGGLGAVFGSRTDLNMQVLELTGTDGQAQFLLFMTALRTPVFVAAYLLFAAFICGHRSVRVIACMLICGLASLAINNPLNSPRYWMGVTVLGVLYFAIRWSKSISFGVYTIATVLLLLFVFPHSDLFRYTTSFDLPGSIGTNPLVEKMDYDAFQQLMNAVICAGERGWSYGWQFLGTLLFWVPRGIWLAKPVPSGILVAEAMGYHYQNLSLPLWGEFYLDGGVAATVVMFVAYGYLTRRLESAYVSPQSAPDSFVRLLVPLYAAFQVFLLRGTLMSALAYLMPIVVLLWACTASVERLVEPAAERIDPERDVSPRPSTSRRWPSPGGDAWG